jgi:hypothetical protein
LIGTDENSENSPNIIRNDANEGSQDIPNPTTTTAATPTLVKTTQTL